jgi:hypothetical protein
MAEELIFAPAQVEPPAQPAVGAELPGPTADQEHLADDVFTPEQEKAAAALIGLQLGGALVHNLIAEAAAVSEEEEEPRRKKPDEDEDGDAPA